MYIYIYIYIVCVYSAYKVYNGCRSNAVNFQQAQVAQAALDRRWGSWTCATALWDQIRCHGSHGACNESQSQKQRTTENHSSMTHLPSTSIYIHLHPSTSIYIHLHPSTSIYAWDAPWRGAVASRWRIWRTSSLALINSTCSCQAFATARHVCWFSLWQTW